MSSDSEDDGVFAVPGGAASGANEKRRWEDTVEPHKAAPTLSPTDNRVRTQAPSRGVPWQAKQLKPHSAQPSCASAAPPLPAGLATARLLRAAGSPPPPFASRLPSSDFKAPPVTAPTLPHRGNGSSSDGGGSSEEGKSKPKPAKESGEDDEPATMSDEPHQATKPRVLPMPLLELGTAHTEAESCVCCAGATRAAQQSPRNSTKGGAQVM